MAKAKKKKKFWDVEMPVLGKTTQLYSYTPEELEGRIIKYDLTRMLRGKNSIINLDVKVEDGKPTSSPREMRILPYFLKKMMRKNTNYVEDSFTIECKDAIVTIKPFLITRRKVSRAVRKALRENAREEIKKYVKTKSTEGLFKDILKGQLQKPLSLTLKKTYPLSLCEIRVLKIKKYLDKKPESKPKRTKEDKDKIEEKIKAASETKSLKESEDQKSTLQRKNPEKSKE